MESGRFPLRLALSIFVALGSIQMAMAVAKAAPKPVDPNTLKCQVYNMTLKIVGVVYDDKLATPGTPEYNKVRVELEVGVMQVYDGYKPFIGVSTSSFSKAPDGKVLAQFMAEFNGNASTHLVTLVKALAAGKLGRLTVDKALKQAACYKAPPPPICQMPCPSVCAPTCGSSCCQQYQQTAPVMMSSAPVMQPPAQPQAPLVLPGNSCGPQCPTSCAPACSSGCCNTVFSPYGKRHHAPHPKKKSHVAKLLHKIHKGH